MSLRPIHGAWPAVLAAALALVPFGSASAAPKGTVPAAPAVRTGLETLEKQVQEFTLANGLRFVVVERHQAPVFSFCTVVNSGSANDAIGTTGLAHMMEHMAFKGTSRIGTTDYAKEKPLIEAENRAWAALLDERRKGAKADTTRLAQLEKTFKDSQEASRQYVESNGYMKLIEQAGGQHINAGTTNDFTAYFYSLPSNRLELWAATFAGALVDPVFREFYKERDVVYEERRMRFESSPIGRMIYEFITSSFNAHPYGFGLIGIPSDLRTISREQGEAYFRANYVAKNMTVVVVGDVTVADVKRLAEKYFADISDAPPPHPLDTVEPPQVAERRVILEDKAQPFLAIGWHIPAANDPAYAAYKAASDLLGGGDYARLQKSLVKDKKVAVEVEAFTGFPGEKYPNLLVLLMAMATGHDAPSVEQEAYRVIEEATTAKPVTQAELDGYKVRVRAQKIAAVEKDQELASSLAEAQSLYGDWHEFFREQERVQKLRPEDVTAAMRTALVRSNRTVAYIQNPPDSTAHGEGR